MTRTTERSTLLAVATCLALAVAHTTAMAADFAVDALKGIDRVVVDVKGVHPDFDRYGLTAEQLQERVSARLNGAGLAVVDRSTALAASDAGQLLVELVTNRDQYAFYFYAVSVRLNRKLALDGEGTSFTSREVWSDGQHGVINPSDFKAVYGYVDTLLDRFLAAHGRDNAGRSNSVVGLLD